MIYKLASGPKMYEVEIASVRDGVALVNVDSKIYELVISNFAEVATGIAAPADAAVGVPFIERPAKAPVAPQPQASAPAAAPNAGGAATVIAPVPGLIMEINVKVEDRVTADQVVITMEAMKMLTEITAPKDGVVQEIRTQTGAQVDTDDVLMTFC